MLRQSIGEAVKLGRNPRSISDHLRAELAPATIIHNEHSAVPMNDAGDHRLVRRVSGDSICELPEGEPVVVFDKNLKDLVENTIGIKHRVYPNPVSGDSCRNSSAKANEKCPADCSQQSILVAARAIVIRVLSEIAMFRQLRCRKLSGGTTSIHLKVPDSDSSWDRTERISSCAMPYVATRRARPCSGSV
jgi:hypothetical protein